MRALARSFACELLDDVAVIASARARVFAVVACASLTNSRARARPRTKALNDYDDDDDKRASERASERAGGRASRGEPATLIVEVRGAQGEVAQAMIHRRLRRRHPSSCRALLAARTLNIRRKVHILCRARASATASSNFSAPLAAAAGSNRRERRPPPSAAFETPPMAIYRAGDGGGECADRNLCARESSARLDRRFGQNSADASARVTPTNVAACERADASAHPFGHRSSSKTRSERCFEHAHSINRHHALGALSARIRKVFYFLLTLERVRYE